MRAWSAASGGELLTDVTKSLEDLRLSEGQRICFEQQLADGTWPRGSTGGTRRGTSGDGDAHKKEKKEKKGFLNFLGFGNSNASGGGGGGGGSNNGSSSNTSSSSDKPEKGDKEQGGSARFQRVRICVVCLCL